MEDDIERAEVYGHCPSCNNEISWVDVIRHGFIEHEKFTVYCNKCGKEYEISVRGDLTRLKGASYTPQKKK